MFIKNTFEAQMVLFGHFVFCLQVDSSFVRLWPSTEAMHVGKIRVFLAFYALEKSKNVMSARLWRILQHRCQELKTSLRQKGSTNSRLDGPLMLPQTTAAWPWGDGGWFNWSPLLQLHVCPHCREKRLVHPSCPFWVYWKWKICSAPLWLWTLSHANSRGCSLKSSSVSGAFCWSRCKCAIACVRMICCHQREMIQLSLGLPSI